MCLITLHGTESKVLKKDKVVWKYVNIDSYNKNKAYPTMYGYGGFHYRRGITVHQPIHAWDPVSGANDRPAFGDGFERRWMELELERLHGPFINEASIISLVTREVIDAYAEGFHFYETKARAHRSNYSRELERFVIPAGTKIILSGNGMGIAEAIRWEPLKKRGK